MSSPANKQTQIQARERKESGGRGDQQQESRTKQSSNVKQEELEEEEDKIGDYLIGEEIGRGSFATVFKGRRIDTKNSFVAIKSVIRSKLTTKLLENLESEISILKRITHRNIVELKDCLQTDSHIYLIMPFCSAGDLSQYIKRRGIIPALTASNQGLLPSELELVGGERLRQVLYPHPEEGGLNEVVVKCFLGQLLDAVRFLRSQNVIHRDIKPQNLLLQPADSTDLKNGHPNGIPVLKVADFGFARWLSSADLAETLCGSPLYMAPEILRYEKYDAKADLWSLGAVLYEMAVGKPPFRAQNHVDLLRKINEGEDQINFRDSKNLVKVSKELKGLIRGLLKRNPRERMGFEDFFEMAGRVSDLGFLPSLTPSTSTQQSSQSNQITGTTIRPTRVPSTNPKPRSAIPPPLAPRPAGPALAPLATTTNTTIQQSGSNNEAAIAAVSVGISAYANPVLVPLPSTISRNVSNTSTASTSTPSTTNTTATPSNLTSKPKVVPPSYIDHEPPPFARRPSNATPISTSGGDQAGTSGRRNNSGEWSKPLAIPGAGIRRLSVEQLSRSSTPPVASAIERFSNTNRNESVMIESNDSILGRDYVVVEKRTVEINALADELANMPVRDNIITRRPSRGFLSRAPSTLGSAGPSSSSPSSISPSFPPAVLPTAPGTAITAVDASATPFAIPSNQRQISNTPHSNHHPYSLSSSPRPLSFLSSSPRSLPQSSSSGANYNPILDRFPASPLALVGSPTAAIAKALNLASYKLFGTSPSDGIILRRSASGRKAIIRSSSGSNSSNQNQIVLDSEEDKILLELEDIAQKALVIFDFADSKIIQILPPTPQTSSSTSLGTPSYFSHVASREQYTTSSNPFSAVPNSNNTNSSSTSPNMRRTSSSSSSSVPFVMASSLKAEILAAEALVLYLKSLAFLGKGIEKARKFWSTRSSSTEQTGVGNTGGAGIDFNEAVQWFRQRFNECFDKADFAKSRCSSSSQEEIPESATFAERLIYDRALEISRAAAVNELRGENPIEIEIAYETALWMLHAILDSTMTDHSGDLVEEEDRVIVKKFVESIGDRLKALRIKINAVASSAGSTTSGVVA